MPAWRYVERAFDAVFGGAANPLRQLGALGFYLFWIVVASGIYVYIFFDTSLAGAHASVARLATVQPFAGGLLRSLHRYASDAFIAIVLLHLVRELVLGRFRGFRWFSWVSGVPTLWLALASGVIGYWLVWDTLAQFTGIAVTEWFGALPGFGPALVRNFIAEASMSDRFFSLLVFLHIGVPLALLLAMWIHIQRITHAKIFPERSLGVGTLAALVLLSLIMPAPLDPPADLARVPQALAPDWWYLAAFPLMYETSAASLWTLAAVLTVLLCAAPWLVPQRRLPAAVVDPANCNGCTRCFVDCPYGAVIMAPRTDGRSGGKIATVIADACAACGICTGACPSSTPFRATRTLITGIDLPGAPIDGLRARFDQAIENAPAAAARVVVFGCAEGAPSAGAAALGTLVLEMPCAGMLPPAFIEYALRSGADGVLVAACPEHDCAYRFGARYLRERIAGAREPHLRAQVPRDRVRVLGFAREDAARLRAAVSAFTRELRPHGHAA